MNRVAAVSWDDGFLLGFLKKLPDSQSYHSFWINRIKLNCYFKEKPLRNVIDTGL